MKLFAVLMGGLFVLPVGLHAQISQQEVILSGQAWRYSRVYPLLDGLFQDVASTQLKSLALDPNASNGTNLDALQQSMQFQLQYGQLAGIQNAAAAQTIATNTGYQTQLVQQQSNLLQAQLLAQTQLGNAQSKYDSLPANADPNTLASAKQAVTVAQDNLNTITAQMTLVKGQLAAPAYSPSPAATSLVPSQLPAATPIPSSLASSATSGTPSFPATKQMDNQMQLLWERLSRLVGAMARPDSLDPDATLYLVAFDTGIFPPKNKRKHQLLDTTYSIKCEDGTTTATVLDLFPRAAAVNLTNIKYRDTSFGIGALLSFFGVGISGSYNREHLKLSQLLGQSSYITGHGVGQSQFGWLFGIPVGDDQITSDTKKTFALIAAPSSCPSPTVELKSANWSSAPAPSNLSFTLPLPGAETETAGVTSVSYNRIEYDPTTISSTNPASVTLKIDLDRDMDQQETVSVNGMPIKRARDTFGRAITSGGSGGLLESTALGINTWIPAGPRTLILTLDASMFGSRFPLILLASPLNTIEVSALTVQTVVVSGRKVIRSPIPSSTPLPSLGYVKSASKHIAVARLAGQSGGIEKLTITVADPSTTPTPSASSPSSAIPSIQVVSHADDQIWGSNVSVTAVSDAGETMDLTCDPAQSGSQLLCNVPADAVKFAPHSRTRLEILDTEHAGGPIKGLVDLPACSVTPAATNYCWPPLVANMLNPQLDVSDSANPKWLFNVFLRNVDANRAVSFEEDGGKLKGTTQCAPADGPCKVQIPIPISEFSFAKDSMKLQIEGMNGMYYPATIINLLTNIRPIITQILADKTSWSGQNFVFKTLQVGDKGSTYALNCSQDDSNCHLQGKYNVKDSGYLYFLTGSQAVQMVQLTNSGSLTPVFLDLPVKATGPAPAAPQGAAPGTAQPTPPNAVTPPVVLLNKSLSLGAIQ
jgi:hypothetical protein